MKVVFNDSILVNLFKIIASEINNPSKVVREKKLK